MKIESAKILALPSNNGAIDGGATSALFGKGTSPDVFANTLTGQIGLLNEAKSPPDAQNKAVLQSVDNAFGKHLPLPCPKNTPLNFFNGDTDFEAALIALNDTTATTIQTNNLAADKAKTAHTMNTALAGSLPSMPSPSGMAFDQATTPTLPIKPKPEAPVASPAGNNDPSRFLAKETLRQTQTQDAPVADPKNLAVPQETPLAPKNQPVTVRPEIGDPETADIPENPLARQVPHHLTSAVPTIPSTVAPLLLKEGEPNNTPVPNEAFPKPVGSNGPRRILPDLEKATAAKSQAPVVKAGAAPNVEEPWPIPASAPLTMPGTPMPSKAIQAEQETTATPVLKKGAGNILPGKPTDNDATQKEAIDSNTPRLVLPDLGNLAPPENAPTAKSQRPVVKPEAAAHIEEPMPTSATPLTTATLPLPPTKETGAGYSTLSEAAFVNSPSTKTVLGNPSPTITRDFLPKEATSNPLPQNVPDGIGPNLEGKGERIVAKDKAPIAKDQAPLADPEKTDNLEEMVPTLAPPLTASAPVLLANAAPADRAIPAGMATLSEAGGVNATPGKAATDKPIDTVAASDFLAGQTSPKPSGQHETGLILPGLENLAPLKKPPTEDNTAPFLGAEKIGVDVTPDMLPSARLADTKTDIPTLAKPLMHPDWGKDLGEQIIWLNNKALPAAELRLNPIHLGPVSVRIDINQDQASLMFTTPHADVKDAIESSIPKLREMLSTQQLNLVNVNISQNSTPEQGRPQPQAFPQRPGNPEQTAVDGLAGTNEVQEHGPVMASKGLLNLYA